MIIDKNKEDEPKMSLSEKRWAECKKRSSESNFNHSAFQAYSRVRSTAPSGSGSKKSFIFNNDGKEVTFRPKVYRSPVEAINNCKKEFEEQAKKNIGIIRAAREAKGYRVSEPKDLNTVKGQYPDGSETVSAGLYKMTKHSFVQEWCGSVCIFELIEEKAGKLGSRFRGYIVDKVSVVYFNKDMKCMKEIVLKCDFWMLKKIADEKDNEKE